MVWLYFRHAKADFQSVPTDQASRCKSRESIINKVAKLRNEFPELCISLNANDLKNPKLTQHFFDNFDVHFYGLKYLFDLFSYMVKVNDYHKNQRADDVDQFAHAWIELNPEMFALFDEDHRWYDLFPRDQFLEQYGFEFLWDAYWRVAAIKDGASSTSRYPFLEMQARLTVSARELEATS